MLIGATVLCFLVLLALVAERFGARLWHGNTDRAFYRCDSCDLRYLRRELNDPRARMCPQGHVLFEEPQRTSAGLVSIFVCMGFLCMALVLVATGTVPTGP